MAAINYDIGVSTSQGVQALNNLQNKLQQTNNAFSGLKNAILGFATASFVGSLYKMANELTDMAAATGISTQAILGFSGAVSANGGSMDGATKAIGKFAIAIDGAASGSKELQDAFLDLGVGLGELRKLSEEDLLKKTLEGLAKVDDASKRVAMGVKLFGKEFRSVDVKTVADQYDYFLQKAGLSASAVQAAGDASQNFSNAFKTFSIQILAALEPISKLANAILSMKAIIEPLITAVIGFGTAWLVFAKVIPFVKEGMAAIAIAIASSGGAIAALERQLLGVVAGATAFGRNIQRAFGFLPTAYGGVASLTFAFSGLFRGLLRFAGLVGIFYTIFEIISSLVKTITGSGLVEWGEKALKALGLIKETSAERDAAKKKSEEQANANREVNDALKNEKIALDQLLISYRRSNDEANRKFKADTTMIGMSEEKTIQFQQELAAYDRYISEYNKLREDFDKKSKSNSPSERAMAGQINESMKKLTEEYQKQAPELSQLTDERIRALRADRFSLESTKALIDSQNKLQAIQDDIAKSTMSEIEKKYYDIDAAAKASAKSAIEAEEAQRKAKLSPAEVQAYYAEYAKGTQELKNAAREQYTLSRQFSTGWKNAFDEYVSNATNAANKAQRIFETFATALEDALYKFFTTGKLGWKDFANTVIQEMIRIETKQLAANIMTGGRGAGGSSGGGLLGLGGLFGFLASGGPVSANKPYIVGERGPELFLPNTGGTMVPNSALGSQNVTYNINAVDSNSFKQMLAADPTFLHAVAEQGRRRLPGGR